MNKPRRIDLVPISDEDIRQNWHRRVTQFWGEVYNPPPGTDMAEQLLKDRDWLKPHVFRALALDFMCATFPEGSPPPDALVNVMKAALGLPEDHQPGGWMVHPWRNVSADGRGDPDREAQIACFFADIEYFKQQKKWMSHKELAHRVSREMQRTISPWTVRAWRREYRNGQ
jgi:hypothetical protein